MITSPAKIGREALVRLPAARLRVVLSDRHTVPTAHRGNLPHIVDGATAFVVPPEELAMLAECIMSLVSDEALRSRISDAGTKAVRTQSLAANLARFTALVHRATPGAAGP